MFFRQILPPVCVEANFQHTETHSEFGAVVFRPWTGGSDAAQCDLLRIVPEALRPA
jgi:hypothetical protein